jgi:glycosyltransferase involved in cell wall biosynthesis
MASTVPPVIIGAAARLAARFTGARFVYHCMDIHPEIGRISGEFRNPLVFSLLQRIDVGNCRAAARVVVLSKDMEMAIRKRSGVYDANIEVINNFNLPSFSDVLTACVPESLDKGEGQFRLLFAGNIGRFQGLEAVIDAMLLLRTRLNIELVFLGEGRAVNDLKARSGKFLGSRIRFFPHQSVDVARQVIRTADLCLVTLARGIYQYAFPSKTMTYLGEGRPLLVSVESCSELAAFVRAENVGIAVEPDSPQALAAAIAELVDDPLRYREMEEQAVRAGKQYFDQSTVLDRWSGFMRELAAEG